MAQRRSRLELVFDILQSIQNKGEQIKPTHMMCKSNLSHKLLGSYMDELIAKGMVEVIEIVGKKKKISKMVQITDKGLGFLAEFRKMREFTEAFGL